MKKLLTLLFLTSIHLSSWAQSEVFRIDSIPTQGILLDKGWKWHAGDNPDFAKLDFDIPNRNLYIYHEAEIGSMYQAVNDLNLGA